MHPIQSSRYSCLVLLAGIVLSFSSATAQDKPAGQPPRMQPAPPAHETVSLDFPGGPFSKLVAMLTTQEGVTLSIIQSDGLDPVLPAFSVRKVQIGAVISALSQVLEPQGYGLVPTGPNLAVLSMRRGPVGPPNFNSLQLENKIGVRTAEDVISAIQQGCELAGADDKPSTLRLKYHPATKLLFVAGSAADVETALRVYSSLPDNPKNPPPASEKK